MNRVIVFLGFMLWIFSCSSDDNTGSENVFIRDLNNFETYSEVNPESLDNPFSSPAISAVVDGEDYLSIAPNTINLGFFNSVRSSDEEIGAIHINLREIKLGNFVINEFSGFNQVEFNGNTCNSGNVRILDISEDGSSFSGRFEVDILTDTINISIRDGILYDIPIPEESINLQNHELSASINGEQWDAELFDSFFGAILFSFQGFNSVGNVGLTFSSQQFLEPGTYIVPAENPIITFGLRIAKETPELLSGELRISSNSDGQLIGTFDLNFDQYKIRNGVMRFDGK